MPRKHNLASAFLQQKTPQNFVVHHHLTTQYVVLLRVYDKISFFGRFLRVCRTISTFCCKISLNKSKQVELIKVERE